MAFPLIISGRLLGLLEIIGREADEEFFECQDLFTTIAEHLALAVNSAVIFENAERLAAYDPLTGVANHRTLQEFLHRRVSESQRSGDPIGLIMLDVDHFRQFNEEEGHDAGDLVLKLVTDVLKASIRPYDLAARYGGEEFTVVMPGATMESTYAVAERIRKQLEGLEFMGASGKARHITASLGCAVFPRSASDSAGLIKAADLALYEAKRQSRNCTVKYEGKYERVQQRPGELVQRAVNLVDEDEEAASLAFLARSRALVNRFRIELRLSETQAETLLAAVTLYHTWKRHRSTGVSSLEDALSKDRSLRRVLPCLEDAEVRFDSAGMGSKIPLLARCLAVIAGVGLEPGSSAPEDLGRFDPELLALALDQGRAA